MDPFTIVTKVQSEEPLDAQAHIWNHVHSYLNSMALKCAVELGIPDAIQKHGKPMTLSELAITLNIHPNKAPSLHRLIRLLVNSNFFSQKKLANEEVGISLTINSKLLLKDHPLSQAPFVLSALNPILTNASHYLSPWFLNNDESPFHIAHGRSLWEHNANVSKTNESFNNSMASDARFVASVLRTNEFKGLFEGIKSVVDVGGGNGTMAKAMAETFTGLKCIVFDLPHVVHGLQGNGHNLVYVAGDMFDAIPPADSVLLKWILHDWSDEHCIKILERCKDAIPSKSQGGKVIVIDMVVKPQSDIIVKQNDTQFLFDIAMMALTIGGKERTEEEWNKLFINAGFSGYKIFPVLGTRSIIEVYPY